MRRRFPEGEQAGHYCREHRREREFCAGCGNATTDEEWGEFCDACRRLGRY